MRPLRIQKILVPYDFSKQAANALDTALAIAQQQGASVMLIHVVDSNRSIFFTRQHTVASPFQELVRITNENLNMLVKTIAPKYPFPIGYVVDVGIRAFSICKFAWEGDFDLIVIAKKESSRKQLFSDSVFFKVIKCSPCPVLSVPSERLFTQFRKIIFPVRDAPLMLEKYNLISAFIKSNGSTVIVEGLTHVNDTDNYRRVFLSVESITQQLRSDGVHFSSRINFCNSISGTLLEISNHEGPDMIVITSMLKSYLKPLFLEYYAKLIMDKAKCPVLTIRPDMLAAN